VIILITKFNSFYRNMYDGAFDVSKKYIEPLLADNAVLLYIYDKYLIFCLISKFKMYV